MELLAESSEGVGYLLKDRVMELTRRHKLSMPSVYVGGALHDRRHHVAGAAEGS